MSGPQESRVSGTSRRVVLHASADSAVDYLDSCFGAACHKSDTKSQKRSSKASNRKSSSYDNTNMPSKQGSRKTSSRTKAARTALPANMIETVPENDIGDMSSLEASIRLGNSVSSLPNYGSHQEDPQMHRHHRSRRSSTHSGSSGQREYRRKASHPDHHHRRPRDNRQRRHSEALSVKKENSMQDGSSRTESTLDTSFDWQNCISNGGSEAGSENAAESALSMAHLMENITDILGVSSQQQQQGESLTSIRTFDLHNLSRGDNLMLEPSADESEELEEDNYYSEDEDESGSDYSEEVDYSEDEESYESVEDTGDEGDLAEEFQVASRSPRKSSLRIQSSVKTSHPRNSRRPARNPEGYGRAARHRNVPAQDDDFFSQWAEEEFEEDPFREERFVEAFVEAATKPATKHKSSALLERKKKAEAIRKKAESVVPAPSRQGGSKKASNKKSKDLDTMLTTVRRAAPERGPSFSTVVTNKTAVMDTLLDMAKGIDRLEGERLVPKPDGAARGKQDFASKKSHRTEHRRSHHQSRTRRDRRGGEKKTGGVRSMVKRVVDPLSKRRTSQSYRNL